MLTGLIDRIFSPWKPAPTVAAAPAPEKAQEPKDSVSLNAPIVPRKVYGAAAQYADAQGYQQQMRELAEAFPKQARLLELGKSVQGRALTALSLGHGPVGVVLSGMLHGCEWATAQPLLDACKTVLESRPDLLEKLTIHTVPVGNPDGYELSRSAIPGQRGNLHAVDLNRNFPANWGPNEELSKAHCDEFGGIGDAPLSEPESQALAALLDSQPNIAGWADFHSYGEMYLVPESGRGEQYQAMLSDLKAAVPYESKTIQEFQPIRGSLGEYCESRGVIAVGVELGTTFKPTNEKRVDTLDKGQKIALAFLEHMANPAGSSSEA